MGNCEVCKNVELDTNTLIVDTNPLEPADFYNDKTRAVAKKIGPFQCSDDQIPPYITKGPIQMEQGTRYIGQFSNGMRNGKGKQVWKDYTLY